MNTKALSLLIGLLVVPDLTQACDAPEAPEVPAGSGSTLEEMIDAQNAIKTFQAANADYLTCVDQLMEAEKMLIDDGDENAQERWALAAADYNAAVTREEQVADGFNTAIRAYKAANPK